MNSPHAVLAATLSASSPQAGRPAGPCALEQWMQTLEAAWTAPLPQGRVVLSKHRGHEVDLQRLSFMPIRLRGGWAIQSVWRYRTRDITRNHAVSEALALLRGQIQTEFQHAHAIDMAPAMQLLVSKKGKFSLRLERAGHLPQGLATAAAELEPQAQEPPPANTHNRDKKRWVDVRARFLHELGVTDAQHHLIPSMSRKWKQINKFVEVYQSAHERAGLGAEPGQPVTVVDFGCGKGYLTFALAEYLRAKGLQPDVCGVELRPDLVAECERVVQACGSGGLRFLQGDVRSVAPSRLDVMVALHACDLATDFAIHTGIRGGAAVIMCSPCCHKEVRPQLLSPHPMAPVLQHGIHLGQQAEMITDSMRALCLEAMGYEAQIFEFVALEHTSKNKMILAVKRRESPTASQQRREQALSQMAAIRAHYGVRHQTLESLLFGGLASE